MSLLNPTPGIKTSHRKCIHKNECVTYGMCAMNCPDYKHEILKPSKVLDLKYAKFVSEEGMKILDKKPRFVQAPCPPEAIALCVSFFAENGYKYIDTILVNPAQPIILFGRKKNGNH